MEKLNVFRKGTLLSWLFRNFWKCSVVSRYFWWNIQLKYLDSVITKKEVTVRFLEQNSVSSTIWFQWNNRSGKNLSILKFAQVDLPHRTNNSLLVQFITTQRSFISGSPQNLKPYLFWVDSKGSRRVVWYTLKNYILGALKIQNIWATTCCLHTSDSANGTHDDDAPQVLFHFCEYGELCMGDGYVFQFWCERGWRGVSWVLDFSQIVVL